MPKREREVEEILVDQTKLNCGSMSKELINECIKKIPSANIKSIKLENCNHFKPSFGGFITSHNYISKLIAAVAKNPNIESLELGPEFCQLYHPHNNTPTFLTLRLAGLVHMAGLKTLVLHNENWSAQFFDSLQIYLTDRLCTLEHLELKNGLNAADIEKLKIVMKNASFLKTYHGAGEEELQTILNEKWHNNNLMRFN